MVHPNLGLILAVAICVCNRLPNRRPGFDGTLGTDQGERLALGREQHRFRLDPADRSLLEVRDDDHGLPDELRGLVGEASTLDVLRAEVNALEQAAVRGGLTRSTRWTMSAGTASDLELHGYAVDPANGDAYVREGDRVKVISRSGATRTVDMPASPSAAADASSAEK